MILAYPSRAHVRKHGPAGYTDWRNYKDWLRDEFSFRCAYCLARERWYPNGQDGFGVEHARPVSKYPELAHVYENLLYACNHCNARKQDHVLLDPCETPLGEHLLIYPDGEIAGLTEEGQVLIDTLQLASTRMRRVRVYHLQLQILVQQQPDHPEVLYLAHHNYGFPDDLPDLAALRPAGNTRPDGVAACFYQLRAEGRLPATY